MRLFVAALAVAFGVAGCGSVSNGLPKGTGGSSGTGGSAGSGAGGAVTGSGGAGGATNTGGATGTGGVSGSGGALGTGGAVMPTDAGVDGPRDAGGCVGVQSSCAALHACNPALASGNYMIAPDGPTDAAPVLVFCDMTVGGGGWTVIYLADNINLNSTTIPYTVTSQKLRDNSTQTLIAFRNLNLNMVASDTAVFDLPAAWRTANPLTATPHQDLTVSASVNGGLPALANLHYGVANFGSLCGDAWSVTPGDNYGRVCLEGTAAAFYSGFTTGAGTTDFCAISTAIYSSRACSDMIRFSIAVR